MPKFKVYVRQWVEELEETIVEAADEIDARNQVEETASDIDWDWSDGDTVEGFEVYKVEATEDPEEDPEEE